MKIKISIFQWIIVSLFVLVLHNMLFANEDSDFQKAKKYSIDRQWDSAIDAFDKFLSDHPESKWADDAQFWIAYCLEKKGSDPITAYMAFEELIQDSPKSVWVDDARMHQISLAETIVQQGNENFKDFLIKMLKNETLSCRQNAALALGRLGDPTALPILKSMQDDPALGSMATQLIQDFPSSKKTQSAGEFQSPGYLGFNTQSTDNTKNKREKKSIFSWLFFKTKHYNQYHALLRNDDNWTEEELIMFGMFEILQTDEFEELLNLEGFDRQEWIRKYWKDRDPTLTTEQNEALDEFKRRIHYAKIEYGNRWNARHFRFLRDQYLRDGWLHAPWDARGELYIKFGEPNYISPHAFQQELWEYNRYHVDFIVTQYMTNIYGHAIMPGPLSEKYNVDSPFYVEYNYIYNKTYLYAHDYGTKHFIANLEVEYEKPFEVVNGEIIIPYTIPVKEFKIGKKDGKSVIHYQEHVVIYNVDWQPVWQTHQVRRFAKENKKDWKKEKNLHVKIQLPLDPGEYLLAIRLEDEFRDDIGIFKMAFMVN